MKNKEHCSVVSYDLIIVLSFLYVCMVNTIYLLSFVETPRKFIIAELSIRKLGFSLYYYSTNEDPSLRIESSAIINLRGVSTKLNKYTKCYFRRLRLRSQQYKLA